MPDRSPRDPPPGNALRAWCEWARDLGHRELVLPEAGQRILRLRQLQQAIQQCRRCPLHQNRRQAVLGFGNPFSPIMMVGEGPGLQEDIEGQPFVGAAGQLLSRALARFGIPRQQVYIANVVKCRPEGNRTPRPSEMEACFPYLKEQIEWIRPAVIVTMGNPATQALLGLSGISHLHGQWYEKNGIYLFPIYHPAYVLRNPAQHMPVLLQDLQALAEYAHRMGWYS